MDKDSDLWKELDDKLNRNSTDEDRMDHELFLKNIVTYFTMGGYNQSTTSMYSAFNIIDKEKYATKDEYIKFWNWMIRGEDEDEENIPLWQGVQDALNRTFQDMFIVGVKYIVDHPSITIIDDDKMHYAITKNGNTDGLKLIQHVRDNRKGFVDNHLVFTATGVLLGIDWEKQAMITLVRLQFQRDARVPNLTGWGILADRNYWTADFESDFVLASGMEIEAANHKRDLSFGFTFDQKQMKKDRRRHILLYG
eukprot:scaffold7952_cov49-Attheya_sp.AAC.1